jgi:folate-binding protein YgfZ
MAHAQFSPLPNRAAIRVTGEDRAAFLQGLISNDIERVARGNAIWAAFLTPQGKFLHEFFIAPAGDSFLLDCEAERRDDLLTRLSRFRLRAKVELAAEESLIIAAAWGGAIGLKVGTCETVGTGVAFGDPRLPDLGTRLIAPEPGIKAWCGDRECQRSTPEAYDAHRIALGVPDGSRDMEIEKALLLESGFAELHGVDFKKGCYIGQELTARTHYRALIKKRLLPVTIEGNDPPPGTLLTVDGKDAGEMKSSINGHGLALVRLARWRDAPDGALLAGDAKVRPKPQAWMKLPDPDES